MSFRSKAKLKAISPGVLGLGALIGVMAVLRLSGLSTHPHGFDIDEAMILGWGQTSIRDGKFYTYAPEWTRWEMLPSYFYGLFLKGVGLNWIRLAPSVLGFAEIGLTGWVAARLFKNLRAGWIAAALLAVCPWHFYYSRITGTCVGVSALVLSAGLLTEKARRSGRWLSVGAVITAGLLYYTLFRIYFLKQVLDAALKKSSRQFAMLAGALVAALGVVALSESPIRDFFLRGDYNLSRVEFAVFRNWLATLAAPFFPLTKGFLYTGPNFMADYVHLGLTSTLGLRPALSFGIALLSLIGLGSTLRSQVKRQNSSLTDFLVLLVVSWVGVGFLGPSLSRFLFLAPVFIFFAVQGYFQTEKLITKKWADVALGVALALGIFDCGTVFSRLGQRNDQMELVFNGRFQDLNEWLANSFQGQSDTNAPSVSLFADHGFFTARFIAENTGRFTPYLPLEPQAAVDLMRYSGRPGVSQWVVFDHVPAGAEEVSGFDKVSRLGSIEQRLTESGAVSARGEIEVHGRSVGHFLKLDWI